jgi:hypothetical protein
MCTCEYILLLLVYMSKPPVVYAMTLLFNMSKTLVIFTDAAWG